jgi:hypothetical protein
MMLLGAIVLVIGFLILSSLVARVSQIPLETAQGTSPLLREADAVATGITDLNNAMKTATPPVTGLATGFLHLQKVEAERGFRLDVPTCASELTFTLSNGDGSVQVHLTGLTQC